MHAVLSFGLDRTTRTVLIRLGATLGALLIAAGCDRSGEDPREDIADSKAVEVAAVDRFDHYGLGRSVSAEEVALWDIDVMPDGEGLPEGSGTVDAGRLLYFERCQGCHGAHGRDGPFDTLAGRLPDDEFPFALDRSVRRTIGNYWPWATTIFDYTRRAMPLDRPGSLDDNEVYALTAYLLFLNDLIDEGSTLDRHNLPSIMMPARDRFVPDNRRGGPEIR
jgi:cytochrome c